MDEKKPIDQHQTGDQAPSWFEKPKNINLIIWGLSISCAITLIAQLVLPMYDEHHPPHFSLEKFFGFHAAFGFIAFISVVFLGRFLRLIVKREEDYYDA